VGEGVETAAVGKDDGAAIDGDVDAGGEGEHVDDDDGVADGRQRGDAAFSPFKANVEFLLIEGHACSLWR
jgi:hypothetical protein